ncbi:MAG: hypothetical protein HY899_10720 [Deltaproteobacteria bacterium]|nr:hypothetical protein [Deltaproteobacteria bacterium]
MRAQRDSRWRGSRLATWAVLALTACILHGAAATAESSLDRSQDENDAAASGGASATAATSHGSATNASSNPGCTGGTFTLRSGLLDLGSTGLAHQSPLYSGPSIGFRVLKRCTDDGAECGADGDCAGANCEPTCDCNADTTCEITGPTHRRRCLTTLTECNSDADCPGNGRCAHTFGPPLALDAGGIQTCVVGYFDGPFAGTVNTSDGSLSVEVNMRWRMLLGEALGAACPRCGSPAQDPKPGEQFLCEGGQTPGAVCTVEAVSTRFGGASHDCAPSPQWALLGAGPAVRLEVTTATSTRTANLPCKSFPFTSNPLGGTGKCLDTGVACSSNADCRRCTGDPTAACTQDAQCSGNGVCAEAPEQPVSCGFWCHCGFCDNDPSRPCFDSGDCPQGQECEVGAGTGAEYNSPQGKPNDCSADGFLCGTQQTEECAQTLIGHCSLQTFRACTDDATCAANSAGICEVELRRCFEPRIARTGAASPLGRYCTTTLTPCSSNLDCGDGICVSDASAPEVVALACVPRSLSSSIDSASGITGPAAVRLDGLVKICRSGEPCDALPCGDSVMQPYEQCDDGDDAFVPGDYCDALCELVPCGKPTLSTGHLPMASDALFALRAAVGQLGCHPRVCDVDGSGTITTADALGILKKAVGRPLSLKCPVE